MIWGMWNFISFNTMLAHHDYNYILQEIFTIQTFWTLDLLLILAQQAYMWHLNRSIDTILRYRSGRGQDASEGGEAGATGDKSGAIGMFRDHDPTDKLDMVLNMF